MSWLFSRALVEEFSPGNCSGTEPCAPLSVMPTQHSFWRNDKTMEPSRFSRFGPMCAVLTADRGAELLNAYLVGSRAKTLASPGAGLASMAQGPDYGESLPAWFAKWNPESSEWKTAQPSLLGDSDKFSQTWPRSGLMRDGMCYQRPSLARITLESASGLLPTLLASNTKAHHMRSNGRPARSYLMPTLCARDFRYPGKSRLERTGSKAGEVLPQIAGGPLNPDWCEWFMGFPVGWTASDALAMPKFQEWQQQHGAS